MHLNTCSIYLCARAFFNPYIYIVTPLVFCWLEDERMLPIATMIPSELPCFIRQCFYNSCAWKTPCVCGNSWGDNGLTWRLRLCFFFEFQLNFQACSLHATCLASWRCIQTSQIAIHGGHPWFDKARPFLFLSWGKAGLHLVKAKWI